MAIAYTEADNKRVKLKEMAKYSQYDGDADDYKEELIAKRKKLHALPRFKGKVWRGVPLGETVDGDVDVSISKAELHRKAWLKITPADVAVVADHLEFGDSDAMIIRAVRERHLRRNKVKE